MTNELAIQEMLTVASTLKQTSQGEAVMMGIVALEKQIPKKPIDLHKYNLGSLQGKEAECECGTHLFFRDKYCPHCGQAIDWSEDND